MNILIAFGVMLSISLVACILLTLLSHFFAVEEDPKKKEICDCLPGINCGACGYKGCDDYAEAIVFSSAKTNLCIPGAQKAADNISKIMGVEAESIKDVVAFVACNGNCEATFKKADYEGVQSCKAASMVYGGTNSCSFGCLGFGDCAEVCPNNAICTIDGIAHVDTSRCLGCELCARTCPKHIITMVGQDVRNVVMCSNKQKGTDARKACKNACIGCKKCEKNCPNGAIQVKDNLAVIDYDKCDFCGACVEGCPTACLKTVFFPDLKEDDA